MAVLLSALGVLALYMSSLFVVALVRKNNGIADVGYGIAFLVVSAAAVYFSPAVSVSSLLLCVPLFVWAFRLAFRIYRKNRGKPEDFRYKAWRDAWGTTFVWRSFLQVYMLQGVVIFLVALPITLAVAFPSAVFSSAMLWGGLLIWVIGFLFEAVGDAQLDRFIRNPENKGKIMQSGLWKFSRHPNYFGESMMWWGLAIASAGMTTYPFVVCVSPLLITFLLLKVSGVPMLEKRWEGNPEWESYKAKTSVFVPLPPRR